MTIFKLKSPALLTFLGYCVLLTACREPKDLEYREFRNLKLTNLGFSTSQLSIDLVFYNPNNFGLELNNTDLDIYVDGNFLGHSTQNLQVAIPRKDVFILPLKMDIDMKNLLKNGITALLNKSVTIRLLGNIKLSKAGVKKSFPVDYQTIQQFSM